MSKPEILKQSPPLKPCHLAAAKAILKQRAVIEAHNELDLIATIIAKYCSPPRNDSGCIDRLATAEGENGKLQRELNEARAGLKQWKEHAALSDKEFLQMSDWLIGNADFDPKTGLINHAEKLKERIRDLVATEAEASEARDQLAAAQKEIALHKQLMATNCLITHSLKEHYDSVEAHMESCRALLGVPDDEVLYATIEELKRDNLFTDATPITDEWLLEQGFKYVQSNMGPEYSDHLENGRLNVWNFNDTGNWLLTEADHIEMQTRGQLRMMAALLHVELAAISQKPTT